MNPTNIPDLYYRVCAKRPELAVTYLRHDGACWTTGKTVYCDSTAAAMILARWVEALPDGHVLAKHAEGWEVAVNFYGDIEWSNNALQQTPIEALAAFYLGQESA